ncbi:hypothetical protein V9T40_000040 [Parthenolecanium corni]|uniref:peptidylamidoglycolate lyase n=1 Tax=Parthenolecanium corni TaxID=536013 RepID=A0AAN9Y2S3_9HEMI
MLPSVLTVQKKNLNYDSDDMSNSDAGRAEEYNRESNTFVEDPDFDIVSVPDWPAEKISFGQVSGVSLDPLGNVYVFHRAQRSWGMNSFWSNNTFTETYLGPIMNPTVAVIHPITGMVLKLWGHNTFYLPHGITVDHESNVWITDVAMHQVFKFAPILNTASADNTTPLLELGRRFIPGSSRSMFCKPSAVAVLPSGEFFVSDGYCNARIMKFAADGSWLTEWGRTTLTHGSIPPPPYDFLIPHDLTLMNDRNLVCVSDRENGRIECFQTTNGSFAFDINSPRELGSHLYSASYTSAAGGLFFIINADPFHLDPIHGSVVRANYDLPKLIKTFQPLGKPFESPHDVIVSPNGGEVYVAELNQLRVCKFRVQFKNSKTSEAENHSFQDNKSSGTMLMAIFITAVVICFGAALLAAALIYLKARTRGCTGHCKNPKWLIGRSTVEGFKIGNFLGQQHQGFVKLNNFEESDEDDANVSPTFA